MQAKGPKDPVERWFKGFWYAIWAVWALLALVDFFISVTSPYTPHLGVFEWACPLILLHGFTYAALGFRRWQRGDD